MSAYSETLRAEPQSNCVVCGQQHPTGLRLRFAVGADGVSQADWTPSSSWEGFRGIVHGGIVSTVLDEAMSKSVAATRCQALTGELRVRFRHHVEAGRSFLIRGWIVDRKKRLIRTEASLTDAEGNECAHAWASFLALGSSSKETE